MKRSMLALLATGIFAVSQAWAEGPGTTSANFLKVAQGVRPAALGEAYTGLAEGLDTLTWNPAGLAVLENPAATFMHTAWVQETSTEYLAYGMPLGDAGAFAAGLTFWQGGGVQETLEDASGNYLGTGEKITPSGLGFIGGYAQTLGRLWPQASPFLRSLSVGANLKVISESYQDDGAFGAGVELGALWREHSDSNDGWRAGFTAENLGATTAQALPITFRVGGSYGLPALLAVSGRGTFTADLSLPVDNSAKLSLGAEYAYALDQAVLAGRVGYKLGHEIGDLDALAGLTAGLGVRYASGTLSYQLDYALVPYGDLGLTHRLAITVGFLSATGPSATVLNSPTAVEPDLPMGMTDESPALLRSTPAPVPEEAPEVQPQD